MKTLERHLGLLYVVTISLGAMLGAGLFILPGMAIHLTGGHAWLAFLLAGVLVVPGAVSKSELATAMPSSGGTYLYIERAFGPLAGTIGGVGLWLSLVLKTAFSLIGLSWYLSEVVELPLIPTALGFLIIVMALNIVGVRQVSKAQTWMVGLALLGIGAISPWAIELFDPTRMESPKGTDIHLDFWGGVAFVYTAYAGVTKVAAIAEEVRNPRRNLPLGMLMSLALATFLYTAVTYVMAGVLDPFTPVDQYGRGAPGIQGDVHAMFTLASFIGGPPLGTAMAVLGVLIILSLGNAGILASSRFPFAMARDKLVPSIFSRIHPHYLTPTVSIVFTSVCVGLLIVSFDILKIAKLASSLKIFLFMVVNACVLVFRETGTNWYEPRFRSPLYPWVQVVGILSGGWLLYLLGSSGLLALAGMVLPGCLVYLAYGRRHASSQGVLALRAPREEWRLEAARAMVEHHDILPGEARAVVALLGKERSPETLVEVGGALADGSVVDVMHVTDVPEQLMLDSMLDEDPKVTSLRRRVTALADELDLRVTFDPVVTRDVLRMIHETTVQVHCRWLVMAWMEDPHRRLLRRTPIGWLEDHLACNFAVFKDSGGRTFREILVLPKPGPHDRLVVRAAESMALEYGARITLASYLEEEDENREGALTYLHELGKLIEDTVPVGMRLIVGGNEVQAVSAVTAEYDMMVLDAPPVRGILGQLKTPLAERLTQFSGCSVLQVKTPVKAAPDVDGEDAPGTSRGHRFVDDMAKMRVQAHLQMESKESLFHYFAQSFASGIANVSEEDLERALWHREEIHNTSIGGGVAVPHATVEGMAESFLGVFTTAQPISYGTEDPVDVFFVMVGPPEDRNRHLAVLSQLARLVEDGEAMRQVRAADTEKSLGALIALRRD